MAPLLFQGRNVTARRRGRRPARLLLPIVIVAAAAGLLLLRHMIDYRPQSLPPVAPVRVAEAKKAVTAAEKTVHKVTASAAHGRREPFQVRLKEDDVTTYVASNQKIKKRLATKGFKEPRFEFRDGRVNIAGLVTYHGKEVYVTVSGKPTTTAEGRVTLSDISVKLGQLSVPVLARKAEQMMEDMIRSGETQLPADIEQITSQQGELTLKGVSRPKQTTPPQ